ncbi:MAG TPA: DNA gyrase subunit A [Algoriphagus sp.]|jgi:DNA gyrase subunit A|uniref:DNA gyrase subunit A n=1 Tax=unclassified Algoriphagus TaxID=2641541 RepID=UPI000C5AFE90|nr:MULTISPECIES: DNA gyrase subunit A [unclassified Algoriphagus]MAL13550.1 DNA gyrase subunit A [Algoriphagus sp.]QYH38340.1 DNA gyrase subunit A [Algoriphagus sp. NBT04N3]HCD88744.1 DNA gyrase subunit A [Algoriphagus sp.]|tara:strand:+ start:1718 stop:4240 length:2523 start_codon:yes stop_codon:yes gene_type:complete
MAQGENENIIPINIEEEMRGAYIDYSMSVIVSRALPDVRDGLKPVHRRILYGMQELGVLHNKPYKKSARIVGEVLGKYHPHGDSAVYDTMVRMAQPWSLRYQLVDGQGNFGSIDGDNPAAMRYTEARLKRIAEELLVDINKETVDFQFNFDDSLKEPIVLPAKVPALLLNGASGIAVGMATNMAPHNLTEVINGIVAYIDNRDITVAELMEHIVAPDFPTGGIIYGYNGVKAAFETGRGRIVVRGKANVETKEGGNKEMIVITEIPYMVNKASMVEKTAALINEKKIDGISAIRDESDRSGMRIVYELKRDAMANVVLNNLYKQTQLQTSFSVNNVALVKGRPQTLNLKDLIVHYVSHRHEVVVRRTEYELREAEKRAHILEGYLIALDHLDEVIALIRNSADPETARNGLMERFELSEIQARAILDMRLQRLTGMERDKIIQEYKEIMALIEELKEILANEDKRMEIIKTELQEMKDRYGDDRRTEIEHNAEDFSYEDMIPNEEVIITVSHQGYVKRTALTEYKTQGRGGVGSRGVSTKEDDFTEYLFTASTHNYLLIFTDKGKLFWLKTYAIPEGGKTSKGRPIQNLINIQQDDKIRAIIQVDDLNDEDYVNNHFLVMVTKQGVIKKTTLEQYSRPRSNGIIALNIREDDQLVNVDMTNGDQHIVIAAKSGRAIHFHESAVRPMGRTATGVKAITLNNLNDYVVGMVCASEENATLLVVSEKGYGKRSNLDEYRITNRGGKGVKAMNTTEKTGSLVAIKEVVDTDDLMIINKSGIIIRISVDNLRVMGRATQGVRLIKVGENDEISSVEKISKEEDVEEIDSSQIAENSSENSEDKDE